MSLQEQYQPVNSFTRPPQLTQIASYLIITSLLVVFLACVQNNLDSTASRVTLFVAFLAVFFVLVVSCIYTSRVDPADRIMLTYRNGNKQDILPELQHCLYCDTCRSYVRNTSRHCKMCNRCVDHFDHHCNWINNCIGKQNYLSFIVMIASALLYVLLYCLAVGLLWQQTHTNTPSLIVSWVFFAVALIIGVPLLILVSLHVFLAVNGLTTFQWIMNKRTQQQEQTQQKEVNEHNKTTEALQNPRVATVQHVQEVIFERTHTDESQSPPRPKKPTNTTKQASGHKKIQETSDNSAQLQQLFRRNRSLKYLIGNDVLIQPNHNSDSFNRQYHTIKTLIQQERAIKPQKSSHNHHNIPNNPHHLMYMTQGPRLDPTKR